MLDTLFGIYLADKYDIKADRIVWSETVDESATSSLTLDDALNGVSLKNNLANLNYFATKYTVWTQNGIIQVDIVPDGEPIQTLRTYAFTQKTESPLIPPKYIQTDIQLTLTNNQEISDDVFIVLDILKINQAKVADLIELGRVLTVSPENIDLQTLGIEKYLIVTNKLLKAILTASGGTISEEELALPTITPPSPVSKVCKRL